MIISDLDYLATAESDVVGGFNLGYDFSKIYFNEYFNIYKDVDSKVNLKGNLATAEADAYGKNSLTQTFTIATDYGSTSVSISAVD
ncbi:MAG: hypothetical protein F6K10_05860 [Moorea sp. SIO2B7]|nr:hypothetical protein [Moorena sp. SIO2B7]NES80954.1 hypothetical protein [Moorena sp. SIO2B7]